MKFKLTYLALAVLVVAIGITVWVEIEISRENRQRQEVQAKVDAVAARLSVRPEIIFCDADARHRLHRVRSWSYRLRESRDGARWCDSNSPWPPPVVDDADQSYPDFEPATQPDEFQTFGFDDGSTEVQAACEACATLQGWYDNADDENGKFLRRHPDMVSQRLTPLLVRLLDTEDDGLREAACRALFAMRDRSPRLRKELEGFYSRQSCSPSGLFGSGRGAGLFGSPATGASSTSGPSPVPLSWEHMLKQFDGWAATTPASQPAEDSVPTFPTALSVDPRLPPA